MDMTKHSLVRVQNSILPMCDYSEYIAKYSRISYPLIPQSDPSGQNNIESDKQLKKSDDDQQPCKNDESEYDNLNEVNASDVVLNGAEKRP